MFDEEFKKVFQKVYEYAKQIEDLILNSKNIFPIENYREYLRKYKTLEEIDSAREKLKKFLEDQKEETLKEIKFIVNIGHIESTYEKPISLKFAYDNEKSRFEWINKQREIEEIINCYDLCGKLNQAIRLSQF